MYELDDGRRTLWGGTGDEITGIHEWRFTPTDGGTHVETHESWSGPPIESDVEQMRQSLDTSLTAWLANLKAAAER